MGRAARFTEAEVRRAIKAARAENPRAVVEIVTYAGCIRILPDGPSPVVIKNAVDEWFENDDR